MLQASFLSVCCGFHDTILACKNKIPTECLINTCSPPAPG